MGFRNFQKCYEKKYNWIVIFLLFGITYWLYSQTTGPERSHNVNGIPPFQRHPCQNINGVQGDDPRLVVCLSREFMNPPSFKPYNLTNSKIDYNPTQYGQNIFVLQLLRNKKNGFFIECGALDGEFLSNTLYLERNFGWTGILIEPEARNYADLMSKHRKSWISNSCVSLKKTAEKVTLVGIDYDSVRGGLSPIKNSIPLQKFTGYVNSKRAPQEVQCFPLYTYLLTIGISEVDYLSLDLEGGDLEALRTIPFDKVIFKVLEVEVHWVKEGASAVRSFLESHGYIFVKEIQVDHIFVHNSVKLPDDFVLKT